MGNQQGSSKQENLQRLERQLVPSSEGKWGESKLETWIVI